MIKRIKTYFKSTFVRYIVSYLVLMALLVGALTVYMYSYYRSSVYESTINAETSLAWQLKYKADGYLTRLNALSRLAGALGGREDIRAELRALTREDGSSVYVYSHASSRVYSADAEMGAEAWLNDLEFDNLSADEMRSELLFPERFTVLPAQNIRIGEAHSRMLTILVPTENGGSVICFMPENALLNLEAASPSESNRYVIFDRAICARSEAFKIAERRVLEAGSFIDSAVSETMRLQGVDYLFIAIPGDLGDMTYVSVQPLNDIRARAAGVWLGFMAVLLAFAIPCTIFMVYISRKNLAPILEMGKHFGKNQDKYSDDISAIVSGIEELEGQNREMQYSSLSARRHMYARSLVVGAYENEEHAAEAGRELGLNIERSVYAILLIGAPREVYREEYLDSLTALAPENTCCVCTDLVESNQTMILCFADSESDIDEFAEKLLNYTLIRTLHLPVAVSAVHSAFRELSNAYLEATSAYESRFLMGENRLLRFSEISFASSANDDDAQDYAEQIKQALIEGDRAAVDKCLERLKGSLKSKNMNLFSFRRIYNDIIGAIMSQADEQSYSAAGIYDLFSLSGCRSVDELEQVLRGVCESIIEAKDPEERLPLLQRVIRIMTVNYTNSDFTLAQAAELAGITPVRLTGEFKTKMGMTPMDYLTMLRMEEAKKLLRQTDLNISDVSRQSGYADASSFARRFKQYAGVTPLQYRQEGKKDDRDDSAKA